ncbi:MAG: family 16 glycosylhydrolase, partial [Spirochaetaceae bacterium]|nr:family 16 glycosylhydrolase [Spirochaetaceae bacterium]
MKRKFSLLILLCVFIASLLVSCDEAGTNTEINWEDEKVVDFVFDPADYTKLTFEDNFDTFDTSKWAKCPKWKRQEHMQNSGRWDYDCSYIEDGNLVLECKKENGELLSGGIRTKTEQDKILFKQAEGLFEFKFKADWNSGMWHAVWLMCPEEQDNIGNGATDGAEIDMIEILPNDGGKMYYQSAVHWDGYEYGIHGSNHKGINITKDFFGEWHVAQFVWHKHGYQLYMDGKLAYDMPGREFGGTSKVPTYLKITSEFGDWGGPLYEDKLPAKFYVDYIKVYERTSPYPYDVEEEPETPEPDNEETEEAPVKKHLTGFMTGDNIWDSGTNVTESEGVYTATSGTGWDDKGSCSLPVQFAA